MHVLIIVMDNIYFKDRFNENTNFLVIRIRHTDSFEVKNREYPRIISETIYMVEKKLLFSCGELTISPLFKSHIRKKKQKALK